MIGLVLVLGGLFACGAKSQNAAIQTANVLLCYPETLEGGTLAERGYGEPRGIDDTDETVEIVPEHLLGPEPHTPAQNSPVGAARPICAMSGSP